MNTAKAPVWRRPPVLAGALALVLILGVAVWAVFLREDDRDRYCADLVVLKGEMDTKQSDEATADEVYDSLSEQIATRADAAADFAENAPEETREDWKLYSERFQAFLQIMMDMGDYDLKKPAGWEKVFTDATSGAFAELSAEHQAELDDVVAQLTDEKVVAAFEAIESDAAEKCDVELDIKEEAPSGVVPQ
ncbi:MAG: hypothetical protein QM621_06495 [Aeromicrobium sp.]|uniref:hypothetical protein n=1 Tax=Aeromicrobium sp. TaxID=1871063 RepID=UPI0039E32D69